jgi:hypothetical protein
MSGNGVESPDLERFKPLTDVERIAAASGGMAGFAAGIVLVANTDGFKQPTESIPAHASPAHGREFIGPQLEHKIEVPVGQPVEHPGTLVKMGEVFGPAALMAFTAGAIAYGIRRRLHGRRRAQHRRIHSEEIDATVAREFETGIQALNNWVHRQEKKKDN